jgi:hypothetical protein
VQGEPAAEQSGPALVCEGPFAKAEMDAAYVAEEEARVARGWRRLQEIPTLGIPLSEYPLPEVREGGT